MHFSIIFTVRSLKSLFELLRSLLLISLMSGPLKIWFCQFACCASLFVLRSAIAPKIKVRSRAIERFQRAMCSALLIGFLQEWTTRYFFSWIFFCLIHRVVTASEPPPLGSYTVFIFFLVYYLGVDDCKTYISIFLWKCDSLLYIFV